MNVSHLGSIAAIGTAVVLGGAVGAAVSPLIKPGFTVSNTGALVAGGVVGGAYGAAFGSNIFPHASNSAITGALVLGGALVAGMATAKVFGSAA